MAVGVGAVLAGLPFTVASPLGLPRPAPSPRLTHIWAGHLLLLTEYSDIMAGRLSRLSVSPAFPRNHVVSVTAGGRYRISREGVAVSESATNSGRRVRRSTRVSRQLERARERNDRQLAQIWERERQVERELREYFAATDQIAAARQSCEDKVTQLMARVEQVRADTEAATADLLLAQGRAVFAIHTAGRTVRQVADLVDLSEKTTRHLIGIGRAAPAHPAVVPPQDNTTVPGTSPRRRGRPLALATTGRSPSGAVVNDQHGDRASQNERKPDCRDRPQLADSDRQRQHDDAQPNEQQPPPPRVGQEPSARDQRDGRTDATTEHGENGQPGQPHAVGAERLSGNHGDHAGDGRAEVRAEAGDSYEPAKGEGRTRSHDNRG